MRAGEMLPPFLTAAPAFEESVESLEIVATLMPEHAANLHRLLTTLRELPGAISPVAMASIHRMETIFSANSLPNPRILSEAELAEQKRDLEAAARVPLPDNNENLTRNRSNAAKRLQYLKRAALPAELPLASTPQINKSTVRSNKNISNATKRLKRFKAKEVRNELANENNGNFVSVMSGPNNRSENENNNGNFVSAMSGPNDRSENEGNANDERVPTEESFVDLIHTAGELISSVGEEGDLDAIIDMVNGENIPFVDEASPMTNVVIMAGNILQVLRNGVTNIADITPDIRAYAEAVVVALRHQSTTLSGTAAEDMQSIVRELDTLVRDPATTTSDLFVRVTRHLLNNLSSLIPNRHTLVSLANVIFQLSSTFAGNTSDAMTFGYHAAGRVLHRAGTRATDIDAEVTNNVAVGALDMAETAVVAPAVRERVNRLRRILMDSMRGGLISAGNGLNALINSIRQLAISGGISGAQLASLGLERLGQFARSGSRMILHALRVGSFSLLRLGVVLLQQVVSLMTGTLRLLFNMGITITVDIIRAIPGFASTIAGALRDITFYVLRGSGIAIYHAAGVALEYGSIAVYETVGFGVRSAVSVGVGVVRYGSVAAVMVAGELFQLGGNLWGSLTGIRGGAPATQSSIPFIRQRNSPLVRLLLEAGGDAGAVLPQGHGIGNVFRRGVLGGRYTKLHRRKPNKRCQNTQRKRKQFRNK
jgi:hypothetical protein